MRYIVAMLALALPGTAIAAPAVTAEAVVEWKHEPQDRIIVDEAMWRCKGRVCRGEIVDQQARRLRACLKVASYAGRVISFRTPSATLAAAELARCNRDR